MSEKKAKEKREKDKHKSEEEDEEQSNEENNNNNEIDINEEEDNIQGNDLTVEELKEKIRRSGVLYMSRVPIGMKISELRKLLEDYGIERCYLVPLKKKMEIINGKKVQAYKEGWIEFNDKIYAKLAEYQLNGKPIGGSRKCPYRDELWNLKYLHKFKWNDLIENITMEKKIQEKKLKIEIAQSKRENDFIVKNYEKSKKFLNKKKNIENEKGEKKEEEEEKDNKNKNKEFDLKDFTKYKQKKYIK
jgi:ESF2/ABP1 family protein